MLGWKPEQRKKGRSPRSCGRRDPSGERKGEARKKGRGCLGGSPNGGRRAKPTKLRVERPERREEGRGPKKGREEEEERLRRRPERKEGRSPKLRVEIPERKEKGEARRAAGGGPSEERKGDARTSCGLEARAKEMEEERGEELEKKEGRGEGRQSNRQPTQGGRFPQSERRGSASRPTKGVGEEGEPRRCEEENVEPAGPPGPSETRRWSGARAEKELP